MLRVFESETDGDSFKLSHDNIKRRLNDVKPAKLSDEFNFYTGSNRVTKDNYDYRRKDHISHFLLRLYCCRTEELKKWFIWHETKFLQFQLLDDDNLPRIATFMFLNNINYTQINEPDDGNDISKKISWDTSKYANSEGVPPKIIFKVPFEEALDLVRLRRVYVERGTAFILPPDMVSLICSRFRIELSKVLALMCRRLPILNEDDRLIPRVRSTYYDLVTKVDEMKKADEKLANRERITPDMIDNLAKESFPPCMRSIHEQLRKNHHLKHYGRLHYSLFLKSIGLTLQDALQFFREEFIQVIAPEKFAKEYSYNIRYNYGQEGKRTSLSAYGCKKIISDNPPGPGDSHGCPFRHFDRDNLHAMLRKHGADSEGLSEIMDLVEKKEYGSACTRYFKCKHPSYILRADGQEIYHPNQFYNESRRAHRGINDLQIEDEAGGGNSNSGKEEGVPKFDDVDFFEDVMDTEIDGVNDDQLIGCDDSVQNEDDDRKKVMEEEIERAIVMDVDGSLQS